MQNEYRIELNAHINITVNPLFPPAITLFGLIKPPVTCSPFFCGYFCLHLWLPPAWIGLLAVFINEACRTTKKKKDLPRLHQPLFTKCSTAGAAACSIYHSLLTMRGCDYKRTCFSFFLEWLCFDLRLWILFLPAAINVAPAFLSTIAINNPQIAHRLTRYANDSWTEKNTRCKPGKQIKRNQENRAHERKGKLIHFYIISLSYSSFLLFFIFL